MVAIGVLLIIFVFFYGSYANPYWKLHENADYYANGITRAMIGIAGWAMLILFTMSNIGPMFLALLITLALMAIPFLKFKKDGITSIRLMLLLLMASMGVYTRLVLSWTLIGLPVARTLKRAAEIGWSNAANEALRNAGTQTRRQYSSFDGMQTHEDEEESAYPRREVEIYKEANDGSMKKMRTNSDNSMYYDPDDQEWHKINK